MSCAICETRKEKRFCPAMHARICATCCGEQREVTLDCPSDCPYLQQARQHEERRNQEQLDPVAAFAQVEVGQEFLYQRDAVLLGFSYGIVKCARAGRTLNDRDVLAALTTMAKSYETRVNSGLLYEPSVSGAGQQAIVAELEKLIAEFRKLEQQKLGYPTLRDSEVLKALVFVLRLGLARTSGRPKSRAFLDFLSSQFPQSSGLASAEAAGSRILVP